MKRPVKPIPVYYLVACVPVRGKTRAADLARAGVKLRRLKL